MTSFTPDTIKSKLESCEITYINDTKTSWIIHAKKYINIENFDALWDLHPIKRKQLCMGGRLVALPRYIENYGIDYKFSGTMFPGIEPPVILHDILNKLTPLVSRSNGNTLLNNCLVNWYENGDHYIGPHSDSEVGLYKNSPIISLSLGATRKFKLHAKNVSSIPLDISVSNGDLLIMGGTTQHTHMHSVPKTKRCKERRISITMRCMKPL